MKKGDTVSAIDEDVTGVVEKINGEEVWILADGFSLQYQKSELVIVKPFYDLVFDGQDLETVLKEKQLAKPRRINSRKKNKETPVIEIDLHIGKLTHSTKGMSNYDMLNLQIDTARQRLEHAIANRIPKLVFIHGVGEGVLRMELETLFRRYSEVAFSDASYRKYGAGATEVYIYQNPK